MPKEALSLQHHMFTGELVDNRTHQQKQADARRADWSQINMFSIQEAPLGVLRAKPVVDIDHLASPPLVLQREDPRTDEEKEADLRREAEALTVNMFGDETDDLEPIEGLENKSDNVQADEPKNEQVMAYLALVQVMQERVTTTWIDDKHKQIFANQLPFAILESLRAGLNYDEVAAAMKIGQFVGGQATLEPEEDKVPDKPQKILIPVEIEETPKMTKPRVGFRKRARKHKYKSEQNYEKPTPLNS